MGEDWNYNKLIETVKKEFARELSEPREENGQLWNPDLATTFAITWIDEDKDVITVENDKHLEAAMAAAATASRSILRLEIIVSFFKI